MTDKLVCFSRRQHNQLIGNTSITLVVVLVNKRVSLRPVDAE